MFVAILAGLYFLGSLMVMLIVRQPGACVLTRVIIGLACEIPFAITRYRNYSLLIACLGGGAAGLLSYAGMAVFGMFGVVPLAQIIAAIGFVLSDAVLGGWLAHVLVRAIAKTGVLNSFAIASTTGRNLVPRSKSYRRKNYVYRKKNRIASVEYP